LGWRLTVAVGATANFLAALMILLLHAPAVPNAFEKHEEQSGSRLRTVVAIVFFFSGFVAVGTEVLWTRFLALLVYNTVYTYMITLTVVLLGIVLGALVSGAGGERRSPAFVFGLLQVLTGLSVLVIMLLPPAVWETLG